MKHLVLAISLLSAVSGFSQMPMEVIIAERAKLLEGVTAIPRAGSPGPVAVWGSLAFPLLTAPDRVGVEIAVAAAAGHGKGRVVIFGHNAYLSGAEGGDHARLMKNCIRWAGGKDKPRLGTKGVKADVFADEGFKVKAYTREIKSSDLNDIDVLIINAQAETSAEQGTAIMEWVSGGGGLITGMTGWAFGQTSGGKDLAASHGLNQALMPAGVAFTDMSAFDGVTSFQARPELPLLINASSAISAIRMQSEGRKQLSPQEVQQGTNAIQVAMAAQPPGRTSLQSAVLQALGDGGGVGKVPTKSTPLTQDRDASARIKLGMETRVLRLTNEGITAHPAHEAFPGKVPEDAPRVTQTVQVRPGIPGWQSTGLYAPAGEAIHVSVPKALADKGYAVRIGCHSDTLYHLEKWERAPDITKSVPLTTEETSATSAFGGLIYIEVPSSASASDAVPVVIQGGVPAPLFILGEHTDTQWAEEIRKRPAPWAELACDQIIITCQTEVARTIGNPTQLMQFWKQVVEAQDDITNQAGERRRPERIVADVQISAGYMHSGYPIMIPTSAAPEMVTYNRLKFPGWGFYHELGHNHQRAHFTFEGTGEVTNNVIGMYCYEAVLKKDWLIGHTGITAEARKEHIRKIKAATDKWQTWKSDPFLALTTYIQLVQEFGWKSWRDYLHSFDDSSFGPKPANDSEAKDQFLIRYSRITKRDLGPFFDFWGIPVSQAAKAEVAKFEPWMPPGL